MARSRLHRIFELPLVYRVAQRFAGGGGPVLEARYREAFGGSRGDVLDVGSGPTLDTPPPDGKLFALDVNPGYVARYRDAGEGTGPERLGVVASGDRLPFREASFDECRCLFVLHHLTDGAVRDTFAEMFRVLRPGGRVVVFDMVWPDSFAAGPLAWLVCRFDRGEWVRSAPALLELARAAAPGEWSSRGFTYSWLRLRGVVLERAC
jgi:SAM-dependent methyltransferase